MTHITCILGVDQSYTGFGYATEEGTYLKTFPSGKYENNIHRLASIRNWFRTIVRNYPLDLMVMEGYANAAKFGREMAGELGGQIKTEAFDAGVPVLIVPPTSLKKFVTGRGNAKKNEMLLGVYKRWDEEFTNDNKADAFACRKFGYAYMGIDTGTVNKAQLDVVAKVRKEQGVEYPVS